MKTILEYKWQIVAIGLFIFAILSARGGAAALMPVVRILIPVLAAIWFMGFVKRKIAASEIGERFKQQMQQAMEQQKQAAAGGGGGQKTIDLCPKCGSYNRPGHKCKPKKKS